MSTREILSANVRALIERVGSGAELARLTGVPQKTISRIANGENAVNLDTLDDLADGVGLEPWHLLVPHDIRAVFIKAGLFQDGARIKMSFEFDKEADKAFECLCVLGSAPKHKREAR